MKLTGALLFHIRLSPSSVPKKYQNAGLRKDLKSKKVLEVSDPFENGGLEDDDIISVRPSFPPPRTRAPRPALQKYPENLKRDESRRNDVGTSNFLKVFSHLIVGSY